MLAVMLLMSRRMSYAAAARTRRTPLGRKECQQLFEGQTGKSKAPSRGGRSMGGVVEGREDDG